MSTLLPILIVFTIVVLRMRRMTGVRPMKLRNLWIRPAIVAVAAVALVWSAPPHGVLQVLALLVTVGVGALLGWHQGKLMAISVDAESGQLQVKASIWAMAAFFGVVLLRIGLRPWLTSANSPVHAYIGVVTDGFLLFVVGLYAAQATEMFLRGRSLLQAALSGSSRAAR
ncbi:MAG: hypothetical protein WDO12_14480 [Pseudomonadota bacterium]